MTQIWVVYAFVMAGIAVAYFGLAAPEIESGTVSPYAQMNSSLSVYSQVHSGDDIVRLMGTRIGLAVGIFAVGGLVLLSMGALSGQSLGLLVAIGLLSIFGDIFILPMNFITGSGLPAEINSVILFSFGMFTALAIITFLMGRG